MERRLKVALFLGIALVMTSIGLAVATPPQGASATPFVRGTLAAGDKIYTDFLKLKVADDIDVVTHAITIVPGGNTGWHSHPGPVFVTIAAGTMTFVYADAPNCTPVIYEAGDSFIDPGAGRVHIARNQGSTDLVLSATYLVPVGAGVRIDAADPGRCGA
jgi:quercetin dioxygenase-like cupin family protein